MIGKLLLLSILVIAFFVGSQLFVDYTGMSVHRLGLFNASIESFNDDCDYICGEYETVLTCPCNRCVCYCIKNEYFGLTRHEINKQTCASGVPIWPEN